MHLVRKKKWWNVKGAEKRWLERTLDRDTVSDVVT